MHQGYISEAMDWGVQGLLLHLGFTFTAIWSAFKTSRFRKKIGDSQTSFLGSCLIGGFAGLLVGAFVGDFYHLEWGYWLVIIAVCYTKIFGQANYGVLPEAKISAAQAENGDPDFLRELSLGTA